MKTLEDLFLEGLGDMYYAEQQMVKSLPKLAKVATAEDLREAIESHLIETEGHVEKVQGIFEAFGREPKSKKCAAILGIIKEAEELVSENKKSPTINAAIIFAAQKAEHYEIASYGTLREWAEQLDNADAVDLIEDILDEEKAADQKLTSLAISAVNAAAQKSAGNTA
jgi:ferritin-like metal-binding protein YciE